jgi:hypothetical protein
VAPMVPRRQRSGRPTGQIKANPVADRGVFVSFRGAELGDGAPVVDRDAGVRPIGRHIDVMVRVRQWVPTPEFCLRGSVSEVAQSGPLRDIAARVPTSTTPRTTRTGALPAQWFTGDRLVSS